MACGKKKPFYICVETLIIASKTARHALRWQGHLICASVMGVAVFRSDAPHLVDHERLSKVTV